MSKTLAKVSVMRISIPLDVSSRPLNPPPRFIRFRRPTPLLTLFSSFFLRVLLKRNMLGVYFSVSLAFPLIIENELMGGVWNKDLNG